MNNIFKILLGVGAFNAVVCSSALAQNLKAGEALANKHCARCHAVGLTDKSPLEIAPPFRVLPRRYPVENLAEALAEGIVTGHAEMPEFVFEPDEIDDLLSYIDWLGHLTKDE